MSLSNFRRIADDPPPLVSAEVADGLDNMSTYLSLGAGNIPATLSSLTAHGDPSSLDRWSDFIQLAAVSSGAREAMTCLRDADAQRTLDGLQMVRCAILPMEYCR